MLCTLIHLYKNNFKLKSNEKRCERSFKIAIMTNFNLTNNIDCMRYIVSMCDAKTFYRIMSTHKRAVLWQPTKLSDNIHCMRTIMYHCGQKEIAHLQMTCSKAVSDWTVGHHGLFTHLILKRSTLYVDETKKRDIGKLLFDCFHDNFIKSHNSLMRWAGRRINSRLMINQRWILDSSELDDSEIDESETEE